MEIGECADVLENYNISELKLYKNLTSVQTTNESLSFFDNSLDFK